MSSLVLTLISNHIQLSRKLQKAQTLKTPKSPHSGSPRCLLKKAVASSPPPSTMSLTPTSSSLTMSLLLLLLLVLLVPLTVTSDEYPARSVRDVLRSYGLPAGLFPDSVESYTLDHTGFLEVHMDRPCLAQYETRVFFDSVVRANLSFRQMKVLEGMSREELFLWFPVKDIIVTDPFSGLILIDIGLAYKHLSLSRFDYPPVCRSQGLWLQIGGRKGLGFLEQS